MSRILAVLVLVLAAAGAFAQEDPHADPLDPLRATMDEQDRLLDAGKGDDAVASARERAKDGTPEGSYLLGRALGNVAMKKSEGTPNDEVQRLLDEARDAFEKSKEAGGLLYAPAHLGLARVARVRKDLDGAISELRQALRISKNFKAAALELAQTLWEKRLPSDAEFVLFQFLAERPNDGDARLVLGMLKLQRKRFAEAEPEFRAVLAADPGNVSARKLLAADLMYQEKFKESAEHWEMVRRASPKDDEPYITLFHVYRQLKMRDEAVAVLNDLANQLPGTEPARRANSLLEQLRTDPSAWDEQAKSTPEELAAKLESNDPVILLRTLGEMRSYRWDKLPPRVYRLLLKDGGDAPTRLAAVRLIGELADPQTLVILEILLQHPAERETDSDTRKEVAHAISMLKSDAIVPVLFEALTDPDRDVREWAVQGVAARTGKWFRTDLDVRTADKDWAQELELYRKWWASSSASAAKRGAATAMAEIYAHMEKGSKARIARYALPAMEDPIEATWRAGYDLFRAVTFVTFGSENGPADAEERKRIAAEARAWIDGQSKPEKR